MKPVPQTVLYGEHSVGDGNCVDACLASILELPLWMLPSFHCMRGRRDRRSRIDAWLGTMFNLELDFASPVRDTVLPEFYMVTGQSPRSENTWHAVVYRNGVLAHDPHPSGLGIVGAPATVQFFRSHPIRAVPSIIPWSAYVSAE